MIVLSICVIVVSIIIAIVIVSVSSSSSDGGTSHRQYREQRLSHTDQNEIERIGKLGENHVAKYLSDLAVSSNGYLFNDFCFEDEEGYSSEIDHILITRGGIFVIETKTNKGIIVGSIDDEYWKCIKKNYQEDKSFKNPIIQNQKHINHLKKMFGKNSPKMMSVIIFPIANVSRIEENNAYNLNDAMVFIKDLTNEERYSQQFVVNVFNKLTNIKNTCGITKEKHIENINRIYH